MRTLCSLGVCTLASALLLGTALKAQEIAPAARIVNPIDESQLVTLKGTVHPLANAKNDRGAAPAEMKLDRMHLVLKRSDSQETALRQRIADMHTPGTASYHKWLTPDQFGKQFGPSDADIATVSNWLNSHGFAVTKVNPGKQTLEFTGNVGQMNAAFHTQIHQYAVNGEKHFANAADPKIPAALAPVVGGFVSLNNFRPVSQSRYMGKAQYDPKTDTATPSWTIGSSTTGYNFVLAPQDFAVQYDLNPLYAAGVNGNQQTIAIINEANIDIMQVNLFRSMFGLPVNPPQVIIDGDDPGIDGINNPDGPNFASGEAYIDVEWSGAVAPNATVDLVIAADTALESGLILAAEHAVYSNVAPVLSLSFGNCEASLGSYNSFIGGLWEEAAAQGQTVMVSAGDNASAGCDNFNSANYAVYGLNVNGLASTPFNVAVGGTDFYYSDWNGSPAALKAQIAGYWSETPSNNTPAVSIKGVIPEQPWNDSQYGFNLFNEYQLSGGTATNIVGGSGGASAAWLQKPAWQSGTGVPNDGVRDLPDVSLFAANGWNASFYPVCAADGDCQPVSSTGSVQISGFGGTSVSSPAFAGIMALVNQRYGPQGQADFVLYPLAAQFPKAFNDVTVGTNSVPCDFTDGTPNCIAVSNPDVVNGVTEGELGTGTTADYNAGVGYDLASGLGTVDANVLLTDWGKVKFTGTTTTLNASSTSFAHGTPVTISGTVTAASVTPTSDVVSAAPTGDVALLSDITELSQQSRTYFTLSGGAYTGSVSNLPGGTYNIWSQYGGDANNAMSNSAKIKLTVAPEASTTEAYILNSVNPSYTGTTAIGSGATVPYGTQLVLDAKPVPTSYYTQCVTIAKSGALPSDALPANCFNGYTLPTGSVAFSDSGSAVGTAELNSEGDAEYNAAFGVGSHSVTAAYSGDPSYTASTGSAIAFSVVQDTPVMQTSTGASVGKHVLQGGQPIVVQFLLTNSANLAAESQYNMYGMMVSPAAAPTGTVTVTGLSSLTTNTATLSPEWNPGFLVPEGVASFTIPATTAPGTYTVTATYSGDANYTTTSTTSTVTILAASGLASTTTATLSGSIGPASSGITISGTVAGQTGNPAPTGEILLISNGYLLARGAITPGTGISSSFSFSFNSEYLYPGTNAITVQYLGDTVYNESATAVSPVSNALSDFTMQTMANTVAVTAGSNATATINLGSVNGFNGNVSLACSPAPGVTCSVTPTATLTAGGSATATLTINAPLDSPNQKYSVAVVGTDSTGTFIHTLAVVGQVSGSPAGTQGFALTNNSSGMGLTAGNNANNTATVSVWPLGGYSGTVSLVCTVASVQGGTPPICTFTSTSASISGTDPQTTTIIINTSKASSTSAKHGTTNLFWPSTGGAALAVVLFFGLPKRRRNWLAMLVLGVVVASFAGLGCGSTYNAGVSTSTGPTGTPVGSYIVTVTGTSGSLTQTTTFNLTVSK